MKTILAIDFDKHACATYAANFPDVDVRCAKVEDVSIPHADIVTGGFPCQPHSVAGKRMASSDERDGGEAFVNAIEVSKCRMFLGENVAGLLTSEDGVYFANLVARAEAAGYVVEYRLLDSVNFGVPQFRKRVWIWGIRSDLYAAGMRHQWPKPTHAWPWPEAGMFGGELLPAVTVGQSLNIPHRQCDGTWFEPFGEPFGEVHKNRAASVERRNHPVNEPMPTMDVACGKNFNCMSEPSPTLVGGSSASHTNGASVVNDRKFREQFGTMQPHGNRGEVPFRVDSPSDTLRGAIPGCSDAQLYRWSPAMLAKHPPASPASPVLAKWYKGGAEGLLLTNVSGIEGSTCESPYFPPSQPSRTLRAAEAVSFVEGVMEDPQERGKRLREQRKRRAINGKTVEVVDDPKHQPHQPHQPANSLTSGGNGHGPTENTLKLAVDGRTWDQRHQPAEPAEPAGTVRARSPRDGGRCTENVIREGIMVRRLTVQECMRLQSMPDDFKWPAGIPKTHQYRIIGNGQASLMVHRLAECLRCVDPESKTHISLFCGGGVGDVGFHGKYWEYGHE